MPEHWIESDKLTKKFGDKIALNKVSLIVDDGIALLFGPNGSGKSTLISLMEGLLLPTAGRISITGMNPARNAKQVMKQLAFLPERPQYFGSNTVIDYLYWMISIGGAKKSNIEKLLDRFEIRYLLEQKFSLLSLGEMQLVTLVGILSFDRKYYVLDEPNANLDPSKRLVLSAEISEMKKQGKSFLISTHMLDELISIVDHIIVISKGSVKMLITNRSKESDNQFSVYLISSDRDRLMESLKPLNPRIYGNFVIVDGHSLGFVLNALNEIDRGSLLSAFSYPRVIVDE